MRLILSEWLIFGKMWKNMEKTAVFPGGYGRIGEIPHGRPWPDWGLSTLFSIILVACDEIC